MLGRVGDRIGRRALLTLSIALMGGATLVLGLLPTYAQIGMAAPILLMLMRVVQGFSLGGEFTGSMVYTTEQRRRCIARPGQQLDRGRHDAGLHPRIRHGVARQRLADAPIRWHAWGWRIPFVGSVVFCVVGYLLRRGINETDGRPEGRAGSVRRSSPSLVADWRPIVQTFGIVAMTNAAYYLTFTFAVERRKAAWRPAIGGRRCSCW